MNTGDLGTHGFRVGDFAPRGKISLSPEAMREAREFLSQLQNHENTAKWIIAFTWCYKRSVKKDSDSPMVDEGPGIDVAGYRSSEIPSEAVEERDGVPLVFIIPSDKLSQARRKEIVEVKLPSGRLSYALE